MRIIGGRKGGLRIQVPKNLPVRPTTDLAKEALFNILQHELDWDNIENALELFAGTGGMSLELASRGVKNVLAVDKHSGCVRFIQETSAKLGLTEIRTRKADAFDFIKQSKQKFDFIFADPPYDLDRLRILPQLIFSSGLLTGDGLLVLEFPSTLLLPEFPEVREIRKYGYSSFAFYRNAPKI